MDSFVENNLFLIITAALYLVLVVTGWKRGFVRMVASFVSVACAAIIAKFVSPALIGYFSENASWSAFVDTGILPNLKGVLREQVFCIIGYVAVFLISLILLKILAAALDRIMDLPLLNLLNGSLGAALGFCEATVYVWVLMLIVAVLPNVELFRKAAEEIETAPVLSFLARNNIIMAFIAGLFR